MTQKDAAEFLKGRAVFATLPAREIEGLRALVREETYRARDYVFMEGDSSAWFCIVRVPRPTAPDVGSHRDSPSGGHSWPGPRISTRRDAVRRSRASRVSRREPSRRASATYSAS